MMIHRLRHNFDLVAVEDGSLSINWTHRTEKIMQLFGTYVQTGLT
jgi:hypothetical protein